MNLKAVFERKPAELGLREFEVVKTIRLSAEMFQDVLEKPGREYDFIQENAERMDIDREGVYRCLLLTGEGRRDGLLVQLEGAAYCRYTSYVPDASALVFMEQEQKQENPAPALWDLLSTRWEDIHLIPSDVEIEPATIVELDQNTLTDTGKAAWADVLGARVQRVYQGTFGLQIELLGAKPSRVQSFSEMLAGYCSQNNYEKWVTEQVEAPDGTPQMKQ